MPTVQGAGSVQPNVTAGTDFAVAQQAANVIRSAANVQVTTMTSGGTAPAVGSGNTGELDVNAVYGASILATGYQYFVVGDTTQAISVTAGGAANQGVILGTNTSTNAVISFNSGGGSGTIVGGDGAKSINTGAGTNFAVYTGAGNDTISLASSPAIGRNTVAAGAGANVVSLGAAPTQVRSTGSDTIGIGTGAATVQAIGMANVSVSGGTGARTVINAAGVATVSGGSSTVLGGTGGGQFYGGAAGNNLLLGGSGASYLTGGGNGDILIATSTTGTQVLQAGSGNETLLGSLSTMDNIYRAGTGSDLIIAGSGNDTIYAGSGSSTVTGGGGSDVFVFNTLVGHGGSVTIMDFAPGADRVSLAGYPDTGANLAAAAQPVGPATSRVTLSDGTSITFVGIAAVDKSFFV